MRDDDTQEVVITVTPEEEVRLRAALRAAGLPADGSAEELVREALRARLPRFLGHRAQPAPAPVVALDKRRGA